VKTFSEAKSQGLETFPYDVVDYLGTPKDRAEYLDVWLEDFPEDIKGLSKAIGDLARAHGMSEVASTAGVSRVSLYRSLSERGNPSFATVMKVLTAMGIRLRAEPVNPEGAPSPASKSDPES
jgi:probable addiction module antidote protein